MAFIESTLAALNVAWLIAHKHELCNGTEHLREELARVEGLGGEGLMVRQPKSRYESGRSNTLLKVKSFHDTEARVLAHVPGLGRHKGRLGALLVELPDGTQFNVGTGFSDVERENPPKVGSIITFRYQELSNSGGTDGQMTQKDFDSDEKTQAEANKLIAEKTKKGYAEK